MMSTSHTQGKETSVRKSPLYLEGTEFIEFASAQPEQLKQVFEILGFKKIARHKSKNVDLYRQGDINFIINSEPNSFGERFTKAHGPCVCATAFRVKNAEAAHREALSRGAKNFEGEKFGPRGKLIPAIYGIGDSLVYFVDHQGTLSIYDEDFDFISKGNNEGVGLLRVDHMTNNVPMGTMDKWASFYQSIFEFREIRYFDIKGVKTGLVSRAMSSQDSKVMIPINEPTDPKSQIQEYLNEYHGPGIQHIALTTNDICKTVEALRAKGVEFLDTPDSYYEDVPTRLPNVTEKLERLRNLKVQVDGDEKGYLLQIFTKNLVGPIFIEVIQRKNHGGFGEGNFQALFNAMERDQMRRGVL